ncbi:MAG TPA: DUF3014 domain-containing protein [Anaeromyxobacteraceae bacterium]|nr:DUF3014 domain-containing protein [Anaeromyxobacteraceae bacterium]
MDPERPRSAIQKPSPVPLVLVVLAMVAAGGAGVWWVLGRGPAPAPAAVEGATGPAPAAAGTPAPATGGPVDPARARALAEAISLDPLARAVLLEPEMYRRWAVAVENVAGGVVPRKQLAALAPSKPFAVARRGSEVLVDPASYRRYDVVGDAVASVNVDALVIAWAALRPAVEAAYRALGYPDGSLDGAAARALHRIERVPLQEGDVLLVEGPGATWAYADPALERLGDVEKQVLRMGPRNGRILQEKAREVARALQLGVPAR